MSLLKKNSSVSYFKRKALDNLLKAKEKYAHMNKNNTNKTNYSSLAIDNKTSLNNINSKINQNNLLLYKNRSNSQISLKKGVNHPIKFKFFSSPSKRNYKLDNNNNIYINYRDITINQSSNINSNKFSYNKDSKQNLSEEKLKPKNDNLNSENPNIIRTFNKKLTFKTLNGLKKQYKYKMELKKEEENILDKVCLLNKNFNVKNFILSPRQVIYYLNLNEKNKFFVSSGSKNKKKINNNFLRKNKFCNRSRSAYIENRLDKIKKIYPTILNIEGQKNRKILYELNDESKKKIKNEKPNCIYYNHHFNLQRRMQKEKYKAEQYANVNLSDLAYKSQLLILSMKIYQRAIHQLQKKNSFKFNLDLPLYNLFLNFD